MTRSARGARALGAGLLLVGCASQGPPARSLAVRLEAAPGVLAPITDAEVEVRVSGAPEVLAHEIRGLAGAAALRMPVVVARVTAIRSDVDVRVVVHAGDEVVLDRSWTRAYGSAIGMSVTLSACGAAICARVADDASSSLDAAGPDAGR